MLPAGSLGNCLIPKDGVHFPSLTLKWTGQNNTVIGCNLYFETIYNQCFKKSLSTVPGFESLPPMLLYIIRAKMFIICTSLYICMCALSADVLCLVCKGNIEPGVFHSVSPF